MSDVELVNIRSGSSGVSADNLSAYNDEYARALQIKMIEFCPINKNPHAPARGALKASLATPFQKIEAGDETIFEFSALDYIWPVIYGARKHDIVPKNGGKALHFNWDITMPRRPPITGGTPVGAKLHTKGTLRFGLTGRTARLASKNPHRVFYRGISMPGYIGARGGPKGGAVQSRHIRSGRFASKSKVGGMPTKKGAIGGVFLAKVVHPGNRPNNFVERAVLACEPQRIMLAEKYGEAINSEMGAVMDRI